MELLSIAQHSGRAHRASHVASEKLISLTEKGDGELCLWGHSRDVSVSWDEPPTPHVGRAPASARGGPGGSEGNPRQAVAVPVPPRARPAGILQHHGIYFFSSSPYKTCHGA